MKNIVELNKNEISIVAGGTGVVLGTVAGTAIGVGAISLFSYYYFKPVAIVLALFCLGVEMKYKSIRSVMTPGNLYLGLSAAIIATSTAAGGALDWLLQKDKLPRSKQLG